MSQRHKERARAIVRLVADEIRRDGFKGEAYQAIESLMDTRESTEPDDALDAMESVFADRIATALTEVAAVPVGHVLNGQVGFRFSSSLPDGHGAHSEYKKRPAF